MKIETTARLLSAESTPYNIDGNEGISHKARFLVGGEIYPVKCTKEVIESLKEDVGNEGDLTMSLTARKENIKLEYVSFNV